MTNPSISAVIREVEDLGRGRHDNRQAALDASDALWRLVGGPDAVCSDDALGAIRDAKAAVKDLRAWFSEREIGPPKDILDEIEAALGEAKHAIDDAFSELS